MTTEAIRAGLADFTAETDPASKHLKLASLVSAVFRQRDIELVVVGGSAIEFYTDGGYVSGDLDLCLVSPSRGRLGRGPSPCCQTRVRYPPIARSPGRRNCR